ncbi:MAG: hypothetical protein LC750_00480 [Actinobacteria bacterium]|nr:hypothetical protein [Actinomycetota bacterium]
MDADLLFSDAQAVTATAASTNYYDTGPLYSGNTGRNLGVAELYFSITVDVAMTDSGSDSTITVSLETDDNTSFSSVATVATLVVIPALTAAGTKFFVRVPLAGAVPFERYLQLKYTTTNGNLTTGSFTAAIIKNIDSWTSYTSAVSTGI